MYVSQIALSASSVGDFNFISRGGMRAFMPCYFEEPMTSVLKKLLPLQNCSVVSVAAEESISDVTLYSWLKQCRQ